MSVRRTAPPQFLFLSSGSREEVKETGTERSGASALNRGLPHELLPPRCYVTSWTVIMLNLWYTEQTHQHWTMVSMSHDHKISVSSAATQITRVTFLWVQLSVLICDDAVSGDLVRWVALPERPPLNSEGESADLLTRHIILQPKWSACWQPNAAPRTLKDIQSHISMLRVSSSCRRWFIWITGCVRAFLKKEEETETDGGVLSLLLHLGHNPDHSVCEPECGY